MNNTISVKSKKQIIIHPFLFAIFPILSLFAYNNDVVSFDEIILPLLLAIFITLLIWLVLSFILKNKNKSGFITSIGLVLFFSYGHIYIMLNENQIDAELSHLFLLIPAFILFGLGSYFFIKTKKPLNNATKILNVVSISLIIISFLSMGEYLISEKNFVNNLDEETLSDTIMPVNAEIFPNVYYIILDEYSGSKSMERILNYDNSEFINFLTKNGFYVVSDSFSNYALTTFSVGSILNMKYINDISEEKGKIHLATRDNPVFQNFKSKGYTIYSISAGPETIKNFKLSDFSLCEPTNFVTSDFSTMLIRTTILNPIHVKIFSGDSRDKILCGFSELIKISMKNDDPKFVFAHLNLPHRPYLFGPNGEPITPKSLTPDNPKGNWNPELYIGHIKFTNKKMQEVIEKITQNDDSAVIIIESDHGMRGGYADNEYDKTLKLFNNFKAYYFPGKERNMELETSTSVNSFRILFNLYFDEQHKLLENKMFTLWSEENPGNWTEVTDQLVFSSVNGAEISNNSPSFLEIKGDPATSGLVTYQIVVSGQISLGPNANPSDILSPDGTTIDGTVLSTGIDDYTFTGNIVSITADKHVFSSVDGAQVSNISPSP